jgi:nicotinate phosphoribosyltransferase
VVYEPPPLEETRRRTQSQLGCLHPTIKRLINPHEYPVGLERSLHELKTRLILEARGLGGGEVGKWESGKVGR